MISAIKLFRHEILSRKWILLALVLIVILVSFVQVFPITIMRRIIDSAVSSGEHSQLLKMGLIFVLLQVLNVLLKYLFQTTNKTYNVHLEHRIRSRLFSHIMLLPLAFHRSRKGRNELFVDLNDSTMMSASFVVEPILYIIETVLIFAFGFYFIWQIDPLLTVVVVPIGGAITATVLLTGKKVKSLASYELESKSALFTCLLESVRGIYPVKLAVREHLQSEVFKTLSKKYGTSATQAFNYQARTQALHTFTFMLLIGVVLVLGAFRVQAGHLTIGGLTSIMMYNHLLVDPILGFFTFYQSYKSISVGFSRISRILDIRPEELYTGLIPEIESGFRIDFRDVHFSYPSGDAVLAGIDLNIEPGEKLVITGDNGSGKSTLLQLLIGYSDRYSGSIRVGGVEVKDYMKSSLRNSISYMPQSYYIFDGTIEQNIKLFNPDLSDRKYTEILRLLDLQDLVEELDNNSDRELGQDGIGLSAGQCQRVVLARTLAKDADIYILDEFNAHLDAKINKALYERIIGYLSDRTVIFVEHKYELISHVNRIIKINEGQVAEISIQCEM
ncbi:hypothetical protein CSA37_08880 [Candidatus Fermentibacteria bacterium]|nr:MAG: hypothetical protein CSA37_08880 [Candidatus Fermentibacteria bacterium]